MEGNSVAASSSSLKMAWFISLISSRNVSMEVREVRVSSVLEFSLHCSISSSILLTVLCMVSFTFRSPKGVPCVFQVSSRLSHALVVSSTFTVSLYISCIWIFIIGIIWLCLFIVFFHISLCVNQYGYRYIFGSWKRWLWMWNRIVTQNTQLAKHR